MDRNVELDPTILDRPTTDDVVDLLDDLRREGFSLGIDQYLLAEKLRSAWLAGSPSSHQGLASSLGPVLCKSAHEQAVFAERFANRELLWRPIEPSAAPAPEPPRPHRAPPAAAGWSWALLGALLLVALSILLGRFGPPPSPPGPLPTQIASEPTVQETPAAPPAARETTAAVRPTQGEPNGQIHGAILDRSDRAVAGAVVSLADGARAISDASGSFTLEPRTIRDVSLTVSHPDHQTCAASLPGAAPERIEIRLSASLRRFAAAARTALPLAPLIAFACWLGWSRSRRRLIIERLPTREQIDLTAVPLPPPRELLFASARAKRAQVELAIHRAVQSTDLDEAATVEAMAAALGLYRPIYRVRRVLPAYLVLGDRIGVSDQQARVVEEILNAVATPEATINRFWFSGDPRICVSADRRRERVDLRELHARHGGQRLLLFTDGSGLLDPTTGVAAAWLHLLGAWEEKAILTPVPPAQWGERELLLARAGFQVLPLSLEGLRTFAASLRDLSEATAPPSRWSPPYPSLLEARPTRWLERNPPSASDREELFRQLRLYLQEDVFRWLCACAVYPTLSWYLTIFLGIRLQRAQGGRVLDEDGLLRLVRLPWFRHGSMPDWLRVTLLSCLSQADEETVRDALTGLLVRELGDPFSPFTLEFGSGEKDRRPARRVRRRQRRHLRDLLRYRTTPGPLRDYVFVTFLLGRRPDKLQLVAPSALQRIVYRRGVSALGMRPGFVLFLSLCGVGLGWMAGALMPRLDATVPCDLVVLPSPRPVATPSAAPEPSATLAATAVALPPPTPEVAATPTASAVAPSREPSATPGRTATASPKPSATPDMSRAALAKIRFTPASLSEMTYGRPQDFAVEIPPQVPADLLTIKWTIDGTEVAQGRRFRFTAFRPELVRSEPVEFKVQVTPKTGDALEHAWRVLVKPPVPAITRTTPPAGTIQSADGALPFDVVANPPVGTQQLTYVFLLDGKEVSRTTKPNFQLDAGARGVVTAYVVDNDGQESSRVTWKLEASANIRDLVQSWLDRFEAAWNAKDAATIGQMLHLDPARIESLKSAFEDKSDLKVSFSDVAIQSQGANEASVTYQRTETFVDKRSGRQMTLGPQAAGHQLRLEGGKLVVVGKGTP